MCYRFDHLNAAEALARWIFTGRDPHLDSLAARHAIQGLFVLSAALVTAAAWIRTWGGAYLRAEVVFDTGQCTRIGSSRTGLTATFAIPFTSAIFSWLPVCPCWPVEPAPWS